MKLLLPCVYMLLLCSCGADSDKSASGTGQHADTALATGTQQKAPTKDEITEAYVKAIGDYIKVVYKDGKPLPDTLFIGKHPDFPDIALPPTIEGANIALVTVEEGQQKLNYRKTLVYLNVMGWIEKEEAELLIVTFNEFRPQHNFSVFYKRAAVVLVLDSQAFNNPYTKAQKREGKLQH